MPLPLLLVVAMAEDRPLMGFSPDRAREQLALEARFDAGISAKDQLKWLRKLSAKPHHVGSPYGLTNAETMRDLYRSFGFEAEIEVFKVLFAEPRERRLEMRGFRAKLSEPRIVGDSASENSRGALPTYNCYSCDGDVTAPLVYVNQGMPKDYETLERRGVSVKGKIVIVRYGGGWRGIKPKVAAEHGAVGCLIYSDPKDDGYGQGDEYPIGGWRNKYSAQRGSVADMPVFSGDPLTPGVGATPDAKRLSLKETPALTKIPCLPIGWGDAEPLLRTLKGPVAPADWRGGLPLTYKIGPGSEPVHLRLRFDWKLVDCRDVIAKLPGSEKPDEWVIRGNHHDAWVNGANDPLSGQVAMLDEAKAIGLLAKSGWRPKRTIVYCSWDGEEPGLLGSTEWVETHLAELSRKGAVYVNTDSNGRGFVGIGGSHSLEGFANEVMRDVTDPETKMSVRERLRARTLVTGSEEEKKMAREKGDLPIGALGSGSDFSPFLQHAGIAAINLGYGGEGSGSQYHSTYDSFEWHTRFADPGLAYGVTLAQTGGRMMLRLADSDVLPFEFGRFASTVDKYTKELTKLVETMRAETDEANRLLADGTLAATFDPDEKLVLPKRKDTVPTVDLKPLLDAVARLQKAAARPFPLSSETDEKLMLTERALLGPGLPGRPWYRHTVYAPGLYTGYGVKTLPGVREAIEERRWKEAEEQAKLAADALNRLSELLGG